LKMKTPSVHHSTASCRGEPSLETISCEVLVHVE
jgi:hypothetical protein